jgi:glycosyltransferase involved in cell wall biosynthesis
LHILIIPSWYPAFPGDIKGSFFREQALALNDHGHQVGVIDVQLSSPRELFSSLGKGFCIKNEIDNGVATLRVHGTNWFARTPWPLRWVWPYYGMNLFKRYVSLYGKPDMIHAHGMLYGGLLARKVSGKFSIPFVLTEHSSFYERGLVTKQQIYLAKWAAKAAERRFAVSQALCNQLEKLFGDADLYWEEMPNIVNRMFYLSGSTEPDRLKPTPFVFLNVALLTKNKGIHNLISAFAAAFPEDPNVLLRIGGDGIERKRLEKQAADLNVQDRVGFLGMLRRDQVLQEMSGMDVFVLPSSFETFGVVLIESLALGKPVIATRCGGPESIVREQDGMLVPTDDVPALIEAMKVMRSNYKTYDSLEIRKACIDRYSESVIAERLSAIYKAVLSETTGDGG